MYLYFRIQMKAYAIGLSEKYVQEIFFAGFHDYQILVIVCQIFLTDFFGTSFCYKL